MPFFQFLILVYTTGLNVQLIVIDPYRWNVIWHKTLRMLKFYPITAFMKTYTNFKKYFWSGFFGLDIFFELNFNFPYLIQCYCRKTVFHFKGYTTVVGRL